MCSVFQDGKSLGQHSYTVSVWNWNIYHMTSHDLRLMKQNEQLHEALSHQDQDHQLAMAKLQQQHEDRIVKMREQYVDLTASLLKDMKERDSPQSVSSSSGASTTASKTKYVRVKRSSFFL